MLMFSSRQKLSHLDAQRHNTIHVYPMNMIMRSASRLAFRPLPEVTATLGPIVLSLSQLIEKSSHMEDELQKIRAKQQRLSEVTDMIHAAHVLHRCVREEDTRHISLLIGDYFLAQSSVYMADLRYPRTVHLIARCLEDYTSGEFLKSNLYDSFKNNQITTDALNEGIEYYAQMTSGSLLSNACLAAALLAGHPEKSSDLGANISNSVHAFGLHAGSAHRLIEIIHCPDTNSEIDKTFIGSMNLNRFKRTIKDHLHKSEKHLSNLPDGEKRPVLLAMLNDMKSRC